MGVRIETICLSTTCILYANLMVNYRKSATMTDDGSWVSRLAINLFSYAIILVPSAAIVLMVKRGLCHPLGKSLLTDPNIDVCPNFS